MKNNSIQLILVIESDKKSKTDQYYIDSILEEYYEIGENKKTYVYLAGKQKYKSKAVIQQINKYVRTYNLMGNRKSVIIYFLDRDYPEVNKEDLSLELANRKLL